MVFIACMILRIPLWIYVIGLLVSLVFRRGMSFMLGREIRVCDYVFSPDQDNEMNQKRCVH
jgi:hypothetical protein